MPGPIAPEAPLPSPRPGGSDAADPPASAGEPAAPRPAGAPRSGGRRALRAALRIAIGLVLGGAIAEAAFHVRDGGAFPHLNLYRPDAELGARLIPGERMKLSFGGNPITEVRVNADGFRGAELPAPGEADIVVVGDSQVFGLGVEEGETFSARLQEHVGKGSVVVNAGVPTYGPPEYDRIAEAVVKKRKAKTLVYVVNFANDLLEAGRANAERHAVWDGWAVRRETAPTHVATFPGRDFLFRKSHAVFALRKWWYRATGPTEAFAVPSEGTHKDIAMAAARAADEHLTAREDMRRLAQLRDAKVGVANGDLERARERFIALVNEEQITTDNITLGWYTRWNPLKAAFAQPGDIVGIDDTGEYTAPLRATADIILKGAEARKKIEDELRKRATDKPTSSAKITDVLDGVAAAQQRTDAIRSEPLPTLRAYSPLAPSIRRMKALCDEAGARLVVVALPLDVQVSKDEWAKYGSEPIDLEPARILVDDVIAAAEDVGATAVDLTEPLRAAEPGAFLDKDIHLTPKGHDAVAKAIAAALTEAPKVKLPVPAAGRPPGRTLPTRLSAVRQRREARVDASTAAGCETYIVDEWLTLRCHDKGEEHAVPVGLDVVEAPLSESIVTRDATGALVLQVPVLRDHPGATVHFKWPSGGTRTLRVSWGGYGATTRSKDGAVDISMYQGNDAEVARASRIGPPPEPRAEVCKVIRDAGVTADCKEVPIFDNPACFETYRGDAPSIYECLLGDREPACPRDTGAVGVFRRCVPLCSKDVACKTGKCTAYAGAEVCL
jgi:lysophospholipase L1-like esterase